MNTLNSNGPSKVPRGIPDLQTMGRELYPLTATY